MSEPTVEHLLLTVEPGQGRPFEVGVKGDTCTIGRSSRADVVLADPMLSREHARIRRDNGAWVVEDLHSRNGTRLNGELLAGPRTLGLGDMIALGNCILTVGPKLEEAKTPSSVSGSLRGKSYMRPASDILKSAAMSRQAIAEAEISRLRRFAERLQPLIEVNQALAKIVGLDDLLNLILTRAFQQLKPEEGAVFLTRKDGTVYSAVSRTVAPEGQALFNSSTLADEVVVKGQAVLVQDAQLDQRFGASDSVVQSGIHSLIAAPFLDPDGASLGMIALCSRSTARQFQEDDLELLTSLAAVAALRIRNVALIEEAAVRRRIEDEVALARAIQVALFPKVIPQFAGYDICAFNLPSRIVSGDLYQVIRRRQGQECVLFVADVSGKGIGAALLTASLEALCAAPIEAGRSPDRVFSRVSALLHRRTAPERYATALIAVLKTDSGKVQYANAGHNPGLLFRADGSIREFGATGLPLGMFPDTAYRSETITLSPEDLLVLFSDGIIEARNPAGEEYGVDRLQGIVTGKRGGGAREIAHAIEGDLATFVGEETFSDDRTLVILKRQAE